jgi:hypothetical protein
MVGAFKKIAKRAAAVAAHNLVLLQKCIVHKRKRVQKENILTVEDEVRLTTPKEFNAHSNGKKAKKRAHIEVGELSQGRYRCCSKAGHNSRTCK